MRSTCRLFMAAILLTVAAGVASAQDPSAAPPPPAPDVAVPASQLPPIPLANSLANSNAPAVEPAAPATVDPPVAQPMAQKVVSTTSKRVTKKATRKPAEKPIQVNESLKVPAAAASTAAVDTTANTPLPDAAANTAPPKSIAPPPAPVQAAAVESRSEETKSQRTMGIGGWLLAGLGVVALFGIITLIRRRKTQRRGMSIVDLTTISPALKPAVAPRP